MDGKDVDQEGKESKDPGAARFGNFINYYSFNPPENRLKSIPDNLLTLIDSDSPICILDIGCNAGVGVTIFLVVEIVVSFSGFDCSFV